MRKEQIISASSSITVALAISIAGVAFFLGGNDTSVASVERRQDKLEHELKDMGKDITTIKERAATMDAKLDILLQRSKRQYKP